MKEVEKAKKLFDELFDTSKKIEIFA